MHIRQKEAFQYGYNPVVRSDPRTLMDFGVLRLGAGQAETNDEPQERFFLLLRGEVRFEWDGRAETARRASFLDENPWCLDLPPGMPVRITCQSAAAELLVSKTDNARDFAPRFFRDRDCRVEERGKGSMLECGTRLVKTVIDYAIAPDSNFVAGEVINFPGRWSSYPPHTHPQPEIYFYQFSPENGYGFSEAGETVYKVRQNDTVLLLDQATHPQVTAPGYAMYYYWVIRHLDRDPYIQPFFLPQYRWVQRPDAEFWTGQPAAGGGNSR